MKPESKFVDDGDHHQKLGKSMTVINGPRPSPLKIHQDSHTIHKTTPPCSSITIPPPPLQQQLQHQQQRKPVIIYAHSPRVIHTQPRDFMALVQKLTGVSRYEDDDDDENEQTLVEDIPNHHRQHQNHKDVRGYGGNYNNESSSVVTDDKDGGDMREMTRVMTTDYNNESSSQSSSSSSPLFNAAPALNPYLADIPLFTPNSSDYFCSSTTRPLFRFSDMLLSSSPSMGNSSLSPPSFLEAMKRLPEY